MLLATTTLLAPALSSRSSANTGVTPASPPPPPLPVERCRSNLDDSLNVVFALGGGTGRTLPNVLTGARYHF